MAHKGITIRYGAAHDSLTAGSTDLDLSTATGKQRYQVRKIVNEGLKQEGYFGPREQRRALYRAWRDAERG